MKQVILAIVAAVAVLGLSACGAQTDAQKDAVKFRELCSKHAELAECKKNDGQ